MGAVLQGLARVNALVLAAFRRLCVFACAVMVLAISAQVVLRYGFGVGLAWAEELARMMMISFAFLSAPIIYRRGETIAVSALKDSLPPLPRACAGICIHALVLLFLVGFVKLSWDFTIAGAKMRSLSLPITMNYVYAVMPVSFSAFALIVLQMLAEEIRALRRVGVESGGDGEAQAAENREA